MVHLPEDDTTVTGETKVIALYGMLHLLLVEITRGHNGLAEATVATLMTCHEMAVAIEDEMARGVLGLLPLDSGKESFKVLNFEFFEHAMRGNYWKIIHKRTRIARMTRNY